MIPHKAGFVNGGWAARGARTGELIRVCSSAWMKGEEDRAAVML